MRFDLQVLSVAARQCSTSGSSGSSTAGASLGTDPCMINHTVTTAHCPWRPLIADTSQCCAVALGVFPEALGAEGNEQGLGVTAATSHLLTSKTPPLCPGRNLLAPGGCATRLSQPVCLILCALVIGQSRACDLQ